MMGRRLVQAVVLAASIALGATQALAHAIVLEAKPAPGAIVAGPDLTLSLRYNGRIDHARSRLTLIGPDGATKRIAIAPDSPADSLTAALQGLSPGAYRLRWQVLSVDGHITRGEVPFQISAP